MESDQQEPIKAEVAKIILRECDRIIDGVDREELLKKKKEVYSNYFSFNCKVSFVLWIKE